MTAQEAIDRLAEQIRNTHLILWGVMPETVRYVDRGYLYCALKGYPFDGLLCIWQRDRSQDEGSCEWYGVCGADDCFYPPHRSFIVEKCGEPDSQGPYLVRAPRDDDARQVYGGPTCTCHGWTVWNVCKHADALDSLTRRKWQP